MPARFDDDSLTLRLSVHDLLDREIGRSLGFANRGGFERLWLGQAIHSSYQEEALERDPSYQREVSLRHTLTHRGWNVEVTGRIDGLRRDETGLLWVEEIKSVRAGQTLAPTVAEVYQLQALIYAWILSEQLEESVGAELVLIEIGTGQIERLVLDLDARAIRERIERRLNALLRVHEAERHERAQRRHAAERLEFPFFETRAGQDEIVERVATALDNREHLLIEATTGLGKTAASLFPVLRYALAHDKRVFVLTAKTLQQDMAAKVLGLLNQDNAFRSLRLRAKSRMCANGEVLCHEEYCDYAKDYWLKLQRTGIVADLLERRSSLEPEDVYAAAQSNYVCPFEVSLELCQLVQAVVCDYNYAFDPWVALHEFGPEADLRDTILVIDEIHNLVDRGRGYYSPVLLASRCREVAEGFGVLGAHESPAGPELEERLADLAKALGVLIENAVADHIPASSRFASIETLLPEDDLWAIRPEFDEAFVDYLEYRRETKSFRAEDPFVDLYFELLRFLNTLQLATSEAFSHCVERHEGEAALRILCKDASRFLGRVINRCHSTIGLSATLSPPEFFRDLLGFDAARTSDVRVPSPFPPENRAIVIDTAVDTTYRRREQNYATIAEHVAELAQAVPGNCLALFPSYAFLAAVHERLPETDKRVLVQTRTDGEHQRQEILETLRSALFGDVLLLAVAGGVFAEGVDYPGDMLRAVAVISPCLPSLSLEQKLLEAYYEERYGRGFEYAFVVPGMTRVVQAAGRLIRSDRDTGIIALIGRRFRQPPYRDHLPLDWLQAGSPGAAHDPDDAEHTSSGLTGDPAEVARGFFGGEGAISPVADVAEPGPRYVPVEGEGAGEISEAPADPTDPAVGRIDPDDPDDEDPSQSLLAFEKWPPEPD